MFLLRCSHTVLLTLVLVAGIWRAESGSKAAGVTSCYAWWMCRWSVIVGAEDEGICELDRGW